jgi:hypothetical protein
MIQNKDNFKQILIGIPTTINTINYIYKTLQRIRLEILEFPIYPNIVICINGEGDKLNLKKEIEKFQAHCQPLSIILLETEISGKNNALNLIINYARKIKATILHLVDDDVIFRKGTLLLNTKTLILKKQSQKLPVLVGANFKGIRHSMSYFLKQEKSFFKAIKKWFFHKVFIIPFLDKIENPTYCSGQCISSFVNLLPDIPDNKYGVTDDAYLSRYFAILGKNNFFKKNIEPIIKPQNSIIYFKVTSSPQAWLKQQTRIWIGVKKANALFEKDKKYLLDYFANPFSYTGSSFKMPKGLPIKYLLFYLIYRYFEKKLQKIVYNMQKNNEIPEWNTPLDTKKIH